jgi:hypothetical protein
MGLYLYFIAAGISADGLFQLDAVRSRRFHEVCALKKKEKTCRKRNWRKLLSPATSLSDHCIDPSLISVQLK